MMQEYPPGHLLDPVSLCVFQPRMRPALLRMLGGCLIAASDCIAADVAARFTLPRLPDCFFSASCRTLGELHRLELAFDKSGQVTNGICVVLGKTFAIPRKFTTEPEVILHVRYPYIRG
jgi:hypothetical protein